MPFPREGHSFPSFAVGGWYFVHCVLSVFIAFSTPLFVCCHDGCFFVFIRLYCRCRRGTFTDPLCALFFSHFLPDAQPGRAATVRLSRVLEEDLRTRSALCPCCVGPLCLLVVAGGFPRPSILLFQFRSCFTLRALLARGPGGGLPRHISFIRILISVAPYLSNRLPVSRFLVAP